MSFILFAFSNPSGGEGGGSSIMMFIPIIAIFIIFYLILIRPQQKKQKEHQKMISELGRGDKVVTNGGIYGSVVDVKEHMIVLKISDDIKIELVKNAVATVIEKRKGD
jgi:preprotein translocase subunit YajC